MRTVTSPSHLTTVSVTEEGFGPSADTYVLVVDDHPFFAGGLVGAQVLVNAPVAAPSAQDAPATTVRGGKRQRATVRETGGQRVGVTRQVQSER